MAACSLIVFSAATGSSAAGTICRDSDPRQPRRRRATTSRSLHSPTRRSSRHEGDTIDFLHRGFAAPHELQRRLTQRDRKSTRLNSSHQIISYAVFCLKKKNSFPHDNPSNSRKSLPHRLPDG